MNKRRHHIFRTIILVAVKFLCIWLLVGCSRAAPTATPEPTSTAIPAPTATPVPPTVDLLVNPPDIKDVLLDQEVPISAEASGEGLSFKWSATRGKLSSFDAPAVIYTAPSAVGADTVSVEVSSPHGTTTKSVSFNVIHGEVPTPIQDEQTEESTESEVDTSVPALACRHPSITSYIFPQLVGVAGQRAFYGPVEESPDVYLCGGVRDIVHSDPVAIRLEYNVVPGKYGYFGIGTLGGYDVSQYGELCLWAYAEVPDQAFRLKIKDMQDVEDGVDVTVAKAEEWSRICVALQTFTDLGIDLSQLDNINLGFEEANSSALIWVDDFELVGTAPQPPATSEQSKCPEASAEGTLAPDVSIASITFAINGVEQTGRDASKLKISAGDQVQVKSVAVCLATPFEGAGGKVYVEFDPVDKNKQVIGEAIIATEAIDVTDLISKPIIIQEPSDGWTLGDWQHISVVVVHYPSGGNTENAACDGGTCEIDDRVIIALQ